LQKQVLDYLLPEERLRYLELQVEDRDIRRTFELPHILGADPMVKPLEARLEANKMGLEKELNEWQSEILNPISELQDVAIQRYQFREGMTDKMFMPADRPLGLRDNIREDVLPSIKQDKLSLGQFKAALGKTAGAKAYAEEIGLLDFLEGKKSVTKAEIDSYVAENAPRLEEKRLSGEEYISLREVDRTWSESGDEVIQIYAEGDYFTITVDEDAGNVYVQGEGGKFLELDAPMNRQTEQDGWRAIGNHYSEKQGPPTKFSEYQEPGGTNYREVLIKLPIKDNPVNRRFDEISQELFGIDYSEIGTDLAFAAGVSFNRDAARARVEVKRRYQEEHGEPGAYAEKSREVYNDPHFNEDNVLLHLRLNDRIDADGKKVMFIEELQSDWHQKGRKYGYSNPKYSKAEVARLTAEYNELVKKGSPFGENHTPAEAREAARLLSILREASSEASETFDQVPDAPFKKNWPALGLKRVIREALENGYDRVAWLDGEGQAARYDLSKQVDRIDYVKAEDGTYSVYPVMPLGDVIVGHKLEGLSREKVVDLVGKEVAEKIFRGEGIPRPKVAKSERQHTSLQGDDLKVGGEGMKAFYDRELVSIANKISKKIGGGKVRRETIEMDWLRPADQPDGVQISSHVLDLPKNPQAVENLRLYMPAEKAPSDSTPPELIFKKDPKGQTTLPFAKTPREETEFARLWNEEAERTGTPKVGTGEIPDPPKGWQGGTPRETRGAYDPRSPGRLFMPAAEAGATKGKQAEAAKLWQEKGTDSPYFKKWFGKSKVVDENGEPLVVYHGTGSNFTVMDPSMGELGMHFGTAETANDRIVLYDTGSMPARAIPLDWPPGRSEGTYYDVGDNIMPVYLKLENPYELVTDLGDFADMGMLEEYLVGDGDDAYPFTELEFSKFQNAADVKQGLQDKGYDGITYENSFEGGVKGGGTSYIAFSPEQIKSATGNRGTFDVGERNMLYMPAAPEDASPNTVSSWGDGDSPSFPAGYRRGQAPSNEEVAKLFQEKYVERYGEPIDPYDYGPETLDWLADMIASEGEAALQRTGSAVDWYTTAVERAMSIAEEIFPEIKTSKQAKDRFLGALAITSQNMRVLDNAKAAVYQYEYKAKHGKFDYEIDHGGKAPAITKNLRAFDKMESGMTDFHGFLDRDYTVRELTQFGKKFFGDEKFAIDGRMDDVVKGSAVFGPKIGQGFFQNLKGNYDPVTIDLWLRRTFGRLTGRSVDVSLSPQAIGRLIYSHRKNTGRRKTDFELPEFLRGLKISGSIAKDGKMNFKISDKTFERLFGEHEKGAANADAVFKLAGRLSKEWERRFAAAGRSVTKAKADLQARKKAGRPTKQASARLSKAEAEKAKIQAEKPYWAYAATSISGKLKPIDIPTPQERTVIVQAFHKALAKLREKGYDLTPADLQATLWYPEKDIWSFLKGDKADALNMSYDQAMEKIRDAR